MTNNETWTYWWQRYCKYTITDRLWRIIGDVVKLNIEFQIIPILNETKLSEFFQDYRNDSEFVGFNVALPWKGHFVELVDHNDFVSDNCKLINTVYKLDNQIRSANTDVLGIVRHHKDIRRFKSVLILGLGGAGFATAEYLKTQDLIESVYGYDPNQTLPKNSGFMVVPDYKDLVSRKYDLIINATPHGKYHFDQQPQSFTTPIAPNMLSLVVIKIV